MTTTRIIAIGTAGIAIICTAPIIGTLAQLAAGAFLDWVGAVRETTWHGEPCTPYHTTASVTGILFGIAAYSFGAVLAFVAVDRATKEKP